ncbi:hypothetical protein JCM24511_02974 [Saitozyma sp. JCM 24511]|nr:hypothetical protein JCM24511_02974 [Saitozyma sp. JCM 24511]
MSAPLTKKQQKALAFRSKQKAKKADLPEPDAVPEEDIDDAGDVIDAVVVSKSSAPAEASSSKDRKRKRDEGEAEAVPKKGKGKKTAWDDDEEGEGEEGKKKSKKEVKQRFILFVGNLDFKTTREEVQKHFKPAVGRLPAVRLLTTKPTPKAPSKSRGIAFLELPTSAELQACLKLHHSSLNGRTINVELTAGGGGKSGARKEKIRERNDRIGGQRERRAEREAEAEAEAEGGEGPSEAGSAGRGGTSGAGAEATDGEGALKTRGGRRVKAKTNVSIAAHPSWQLSPSLGEVSALLISSKTDTAGPRSRNNGPPSGWGNRSGQSNPSRGPNGSNRRKFQPTGANALVVG